MMASQAGLGVYLHDLEVKHYNKHFINVVFWKNNIWSDLDLHFITELIVNNPEPAATDIL